MYGDTLFTTHYGDTGFTEGVQYSLVNNVWGGIRYTVTPVYVGYRVDCLVPDYLIM